MKKSRWLRGKDGKMPPKGIFKKYMPLVVGAFSLSMAAVNCKNIPKCPKASETINICVDEKGPVIKNKKHAKTIIRALLSRFNSLEKQVQIDALSALGAIGAANPGEPTLLASVPRISRKTNHWNWEIRCEAASALSEIVIANPKNKKLRQDVEDILVKMLEDPDWRVKSTIAMICGKMRALKAAPKLIGMLKEEKEALLYNVISGIGGIGRGYPKNKKISKAVPRLIKVLDYNSDMLRGISIWALGQIGNIKAIPKLHVVWLNDPRTENREEARKAIDRIVKMNKKQ